MFLTFIVFSPVSTITFVCYFNDSYVLGFIINNNTMITIYIFYYICWLFTYLYYMYLFIY